MQLVERHVIKSNSPYFAEIDDAAFASKNLYNATNYIMRQAYICTGFVLDMKALYAEAKLTEAYIGLPQSLK